MQNRAIFKKIQSYIKHKEDQEIVRATNHYMNFRVLSMMQSLGMKINVESAPELRDDIEEIYTSYIEHYKHAIDSFKHGNIRFTLELLNLAFDYYKEYVTERDRALETYLAQIRRENPSARVIIVRSYLSSGFPIKLVRDKTDGEDIDMLFPRQRGVSLDQMAELVQTDWLDEHVDAENGTLFKFTPEERDLMLLRKLVSSFIEPSYELTREREKLNNALRMITDRLTREEIEQLCRHVSEKTANNEALTKITQKITRARSEKRKDELREKQSNITTGYFLKWLLLCCWNEYKS